jgi:hypothetical protein
MAKLFHGCTARYVWAGANTIASIFSHPIDSGRFIVVAQDTWGGERLWSVDADGRDCDRDQIVIVIDPAQEAWDKLDATVREMVLFLARDCSKKISAIKFLRTLTGLGLAEAKRAVEEFQA